MKQNLIGLFLLFPFFLGAQSLVEKLDPDDISSAVKMLGIEIFKYDFSKQDTNYNLVIHIEEIVNGAVILDQNYKLGKWNKDQIKKEVKIISKISSDTTSAYWIKISHPNMETMERFKISSEFRKIHFWKQIVSGEIVYNQKTPLLFYGMGWAGKVSQEEGRYCVFAGVKR